MSEQEVTHSAQGLEGTTVCIGREKERKRERDGGLGRGERECRYVSELEVTHV